MWVAQTWLDARILVLSLPLSFSLSCLGSLLGLGLCHKLSDYCLCYFMCVVHMNLREFISFSLFFFGFFIVFVINRVNFFLLVRVQLPRIQLCITFQHVLKLYGYDTKTFVLFFLGFRSLFWYFLTL